jgi:predicted phosphodiesterase
MRIGFLSDAHGNVEAFDLGRQVLDRVGVDRIVFLGDAVGYLPGTAVIDAVLDAGIDAVRGNHEAMMLDAAAGAPPTRDDVYQLRATAATLSPAQAAGIAAWPAWRELMLACGPALLVHGSPADPTHGYVYPDTDLRAFASGRLAGATVFMGNTHRPFVRHCGSTTFVNVGSCGLPRDVGSLGAGCVFDDTTGEARILRFDIRDAVARARQRCGPVHEIVDHTLTREADTYVGELVAV